MGWSPWSSDDFEEHVDNVVHKTADQIFVSHDLDFDLSPHNIKVRESRDSEKHPESNAIIIACDETGSMGFIAEYMFKTGIGTVIENILERKPISHPHCMVMGIGDVMSDRSPVQISQFEADTTIFKWLEKVHVEGNGGGNNTESYDAAWYVASRMTSIDCWEKRQKKGYLFTIGDEEAPRGIPSHLVKRHIGHEVDSDLSAADLLAAAQRMYHCYHIMVAQGSHASDYPNQVKDTWRKLMGENAIWLDDYNSLAEVIVSIIEVNEGRDKDAVAGSWSGNTSLVVASAIKDLPSTIATAKGKKVARL